MLFRTDYEPALGRALLGIPMWVSLGELWAMIPKCQQCGRPEVVGGFCGWGCAAEFHGV